MLPQLGWGKQGAEHGLEGLHCPLTKGSSVSSTLLSSASCLQALKELGKGRSGACSLGGNQQGDEQAHTYGRMTLPAPLSVLHIRCDLQSAMAMLVSISPSSPVLAALFTYGFTHVF